MFQIILPLTPPQRSAAGARPEEDAPSPAALPPHSPAPGQPGARFLLPAAQRGFSSSIIYPTRCRLISFWYWNNTAWSVWNIWLCVSVCVAILSIQRNNRNTKFSSPALSPYQAKKCCSLTHTICGSSSSSHLPLQQLTGWLYPFCRLWSWGRALPDRRQQGRGWHRRQLCSAHSHHPCFAALCAAAKFLPLWLKQHTSSAPETGTESVYVLIKQLVWFSIFF